MYPYVPQNDDELELASGDFIFMSPLEQGSASEGWVYGTSLGSGLSGLLPENYVSESWCVCVCVCALVCWRSCEGHQIGRAHV